MRESDRTKRGHVERIVIVLLIAIALVCGVSFARAGQVVFDKASTVYMPGGLRVAIPAGSVVDACPNVANVLFELSPQGKSVRVLQACPERPAKCRPDSLFCDSFEDLTQ